MLTSSPQSLRVSQSLIHFLCRCCTSLLSLPLPPTTSDVLRAAEWGPVQHTSFAQLRAPEFNDLHAVGERSTRVRTDGLILSAKLALSLVRCTQPLQELVHWHALIATFRHD